jgi:hypothetical protein
VAAASGAGGASGGDPNLTALGSQAGEIWRLLDRMAEEDPEAYRRFVEEQVKTAKAEGVGGGGGGGGGGGSAGAGASGRDAVTPSAGLCVSVAVAGVRPRDDGVVRPAALARPPPPADLRAGDVLYVNVVTHPGVGRPKDDRGREVADDGPGGAPALLPTADLLNLEIPMAVGDVRRVPPAGDGKASSSMPAAWAVDVLVNPWVVAAARRDAAFRREFAAFVSATAGEEAGVNLVGRGGQPGAGGVRQEAQDYVGGVRGSGTPVPFPAARARAPPPADAGPAAKLGLAPGAGAGGRGGVKTGAGAPAAAPAPPSLASPASLLRERAAAVESSAAGGGGGAGGPRGGLGALGLDGLRLVGGAGAAAPAPAPAPPADPTAAQAAEFAQYAATLFPEERLLYAGACRFEMEVGGGGGGDSGGGGGGGGGGGRVATIRLTFNPDLVDLVALSLSDAVLDVSSRSVSLRLPRRVLPRYAGLAVDTVPVATRALATAVDPDLARAKLNRKAGTLTITAPVVA